MRRKIQNFVFSLQHQGARGFPLLSQVTLHMESVREKRERERP